LRAQIGLTLLLLTAVTVALVGLAVLNLMKSSLYDREVVSARQLAALGARQLADALDVDEPIDSTVNSAAIAAISAQFLGDESVVGFEVFQPGQDPPGEREVATLIATQSVVVGETEVATIRLTVSVRSAMSRLRTAQQLTVLFVALDALFILIVGYVIMTRLIVTPIRRLGLAIERVAAGDHASRVSLASRNEIGILAKSFNHMLDRLFEGQQALHDQVEALRRAKRELEIAQDAIVRSEKLASVGRLAAGLAHEVGNPLSAVLGLVEHMRDQPEIETSERQEILERVNRELLRIHGIIRDLLDYSRAEDDEPAPVVLSEILSTAQRLAKAQPRFRDVALEVGTNGPIPSVSVNSDRLLQVILNLLLNAADAVGGSGVVSLTASASDGDVRITVADDGMGISPEALGKIFEPFYTTKPPGQGTGLGLAICDSIIEAMGGRIEVDSQPAEGTRFHVLIPADEPHGPS
jgi:signal transduction histidine kinase